MKKFVIVSALFLVFSAVLVTQETAVFEDSFSSNSNNWYTDDYIYLRNGAYILNAGSNNVASWRTTPMGDCKISVDTNYEGGADNFGYGLIYRFQNNQQFYIFWLAAQGYFLAGKIDGSGFTPFQNWSYSDAVVKNGRNTMTVELSGPKITGYVNGVQLFAAEDNSYPEGGFGFYGQKGTITSFDNLTVWEPGGPAPALEGSIVNTYPVPGQGPFGIASDGEFLYIVDWFNGTLFFINPDYGNNFEQIKLSGLFRYQGMDFTDGLLWIAEYNGEINAYDLAGSVRRKINYAGKNPTGLAFGDGFFWVLDPNDMKIVKMNAAGVSSGSIAVPQGIVNPRGLDYYENSLWLVSPTDETIYRLDPATGEETGRIKLAGTNMHGIEWLNGYLWITDHANKKLYQVEVGYTDKAGTAAEPAEVHNAWRLVETKIWQRDVNDNYMTVGYAGKSGDIVVEYDIHPSGGERAYFKIRWAWNEPPRVLNPGTLIDIQAEGRLMDSIGPVPDYDWFLADLTNWWEYDPSSGGMYYIGENGTARNGSPDSFTWYSYPNGESAVPEGYPGQKTAVRVGYMDGGSLYYVFYYIYEWVE